MGRNPGHTPRRHHTPEEPHPCSPHEPTVAPHPDDGRSHWLAGLSGFMPPWRFTEPPPAYTQDPDHGEMIFEPPPPYYSPLLASARVRPASIPIVESSPSQSRRSDETEETEISTVENYPTEMQEATLPLAGRHRAAESSSILGETDRGPKPTAENEQSRERIRDSKVLSPEDQRNDVPEESSQLLQRASEVVAKETEA